MLVLGRGTPSYWSIRRWERCFWWKITPLIISVRFHIGCASADPCFSNRVDFFHTGPQDFQGMKQHYTKLTDSQGCLGILRVNDPGSSSGGSVLYYLVLVTASNSAGKVGTSEIYRITNVCLGRRMIGQDLSYLTFLSVKCLFGATQNVGVGSRQGLSRQ